MVTVYQTGATQERNKQAADKDGIRPFHVSIPEEALSDLRRRLETTRWPDKETVADDSQGAQLAKLQELVRYWGTDYDWRKAEAKLNAFPQLDPVPWRVQNHEFLNPRLQRGRQPVRLR